jgi:hypothetical protein
LSGLDRKKPEKSNINSVSVTTENVLEFVFLADSISCLYVFKLASVLSDIFTTVFNGSSSVSLP